MLSQFLKNSAWLARVIYLPQIFWVMLGAVLLINSCSTPSEPISISLPDKIDFNFHVRPILSDRCYKCHGPDENARKANLRLDLEKEAFAMTDSAENRYALVPGNLEKSHLYRRIISTNPDQMMPPPESKLSLSDREIQILKRWIEQGAEWKDHWAFTPPKEQVVPAVSDPQWSSNPIDNFVYDRLQKEGLHPSPKASKEKLIRRLSFDLRGLPPDLDEIDAFLSDDSPDAYEKLVEKFLNSTSFGERLALEWLDLARFADSHGYQDDLERTMWPWRDWVIQAFNQNMPYDQFVTWQLAGDLMPDASYQQVLATGFNRNHKITQEGGVVEEEYRVEYVLDRVNTFGTAFLGITVSCAQCHDHKFDPISQREFYELYSFFNNVPERGRVDYGMKIAEPSLPIPDSTVDKYSSYFKNLVNEQEKRLVDYQEQQWEHHRSNLPIANIGKVKPSSDLPAGLLAYYSFDYIENSRTRDETNPEIQAEVVNGIVPREGKFSGGLDFSGENYLEFEAIDGFNYKGPYAISFWFYSVENGARGTILTLKSNNNGHRASMELSASDDGIQFAINENTHPEKKSEGLYVKTSHILKGNEWSHFLLTYDGSNQASGIQIFMDGEPLEIDIVRNKLRSNPSQPVGFMVGRRALKEGFRSNPQGLFRARLDELMLFDRVLTRAEIESLAQFDPLSQLQSKPTRNDHELKRLFYHYLHHQDREYQSLTQWLSEYKYREMKTEHLVTKPTMVMQEMDTMRPTFILDRGSYSAPTERVYPGTPQYIMSFPSALPENRLGLAQWLFQKKNPLTARVAVNRYWQMIFGRGIVATPEDFGSQGDLPSHPELLDWLALEFQSSDWNLKQLLKLMVTSTTYQQQSGIRGELSTRDPNNILLARGPQARLPAELIRDHALAISGLLSKRVGGPSVNPYQPKGLWLQVASGNQELKEYIQGHGNDLYRKSMYTFWKRSLPPPSMIIFDASTREQCDVKRQSTSTPMQALVLLNDPQFTETSRLIAQRMILEGGDNEEERIEFAFRLATSRKPSDDELQLLTDLFKDQVQDFTSEPNRATDLLGVGEYGYQSDLDPVELASYTVVANAILNLAETIYKA
jgi:hypothetical protein